MTLNLKIPIIYNFIRNIFPTHILELSLYYSKIFHENINLYCVSITKKEESLESLYLSTFRECISKSCELIQKHNSKIKNIPLKIYIYKTDICYLKGKEPLISYTTIYELDVDTKKPLYPTIIASNNKLNLVGFYHNSTSQKDYINIYHIFDETKYIMNSFDVGNIKFNVNRKKELTELLSNRYTNIIDSSGKKFSINLHDTGKGYLLKYRELYIRSNSYYVFIERPFNDSILNCTSYYLMIDNNIYELTSAKNYITKDILDKLMKNSVINKDDEEIHLKIYDNKINIIVNKLLQEDYQENNNKTEEKPTISSAFKN